MVKKELVSTIVRDMENSISLMAAEYHLMTIVESSMNALASIDPEIAVKILDQMLEMRQELVEASEKLSEHRSNATSELSEEMGSTIELVSENESTDFLPQ